MCSSITARLIKWLVAICDKRAVLLVLSSLPLLQCMLWVFPLLLIWGLKHKKIIYFFFFEKGVGFSYTEVSWHAVILHTSAAWMKCWEHSGGKRK